MGKKLDGTTFHLRHEVYTIPCAEGRTMKMVQYTSSKKSLTPICPTLNNML
jgi:hypothetical protein